MNADEVQADQEGQVFDKSLRSASAHGVCYLCGEGWLMLHGKLNRRLYAGEKTICARCHKQITAISEDAAQRTPEMVENPWAKAERLEKELASMKRLLDETSKGWERTHQTLHDRFVAIENQLAESRRNFAIIAKLLKETK